MLSKAFELAAVLVPTLFGEANVLVLEIHEVLAAIIDKLSVFARHLPDILALLFAELPQGLFGSQELRTLLLLQLLDFELRMLRSLVACCIHILELA